MSESQSVSELILEGRWAMDQVTRELVEQVWELIEKVKELQLVKGRSKGMGQKGNMAS